MTVTARYRTENVQQTPISVTALSAEAMEQHGFTTATDVAAIAPNVTLLEGGSNGASGGKAVEAFIRGVGQVDFDPAEDPGVSFYLDDVYYGNLFGSIFRLDDVDHVEILRGPQGTLFGTNSEGGAIRVYTTLPKGDNSGYLQIGYGSYNDELARGAFDVAVIPDALFLRISAGDEHRDGYVDVLDFACANPAGARPLPGVVPIVGLKPTTTASNCKVGDAGSLDVTSLRGALRYKPNADLDVNLTADLTDDRSGPGAEKLLAIAGPGSGMANFNQNVAIPYYGIPLDGRFITGNSLVSYANYCETLSGRCSPKVDTLFAYGFTSSVNWNSPWGLSFKNVAAYRSDSGEYVANDSNAPITVISNDNLNYHHQFSEELDISGTLLDKALEWTAGAYYYIGYSEYAGTILLPGLQIVPPGVLPFAPNGAYGLDFAFGDPVEDHNVSGFVHGIYHITDQLSAEVGVRYSSVDKTYTFTRDELPVTPPDPIFPGGVPIAGFEGHPSATSQTARFDPKVAIQYQWTPDIMTYFQVATGFKGSGVNPRPVFLQDVSTFGPEDLTSYEIGAKTELLEHKLRFNIDAFLSNYKDLQQTILAPDGSSPIVNTGHALIYGMESEFAARPFRSFEFDGSVGYLQYRTLHLGAAEGVPNGPTDGSWPALIPKWKVSVGAQYAFDFGDGGILTPRIDWTYQSHVFNDPANNPAGLQEGYGLLNGRVTWTAADGTWEAAFQGLNLTDKLYYINKLVNLSSYGVVEGQPGLPRTFLFTVKRTFGASAAPAAYAPPPATPAAAPAPPPQAAQPERQRSFQVFFDFDKSDVTEAAAQVIRAAADAIRAGDVVRIEVIGHTDTVGTAKYNLALSERRAAAVKRQLVTDGVADSEITTRGVGKAGLLVPTADGVREPQNRRAEIVLQ